MVWYEGTGTVNKKFLYSDNQGSIIATADGSGNTVNISTYDAYGNRTNSAPSAASRFGYTGQVDLSELGLLYYKARMYDPKLGSFLQTDPIGYGDGMNWYAYVGGDPINMVDPYGLEDCPPNDETCFTVTGSSLGCIRNLLCLRSLPVLTYIDPRSWLEDLLKLRGELVVVRAKKKSKNNLLCQAPTIGGAAGLDAYAIVGGSVGSGLSINPSNGQVSASFDLGVGLGLGGGTHISSGNVIGVGKGSSKTLPIAGGGFNVNGTATAGPFGVGGSRQIIGSDKGDWSAGWAPGAELGANINIGPHGQINLPPLYNLGCE